MTTPSSAAALEGYASSEGQLFDPVTSPREPRRFDGDEVGSFDIHELLSALQAMRVGDFTVRLPADRTGVAARVADAFNDIVSANARMAQQLEQVGQVVGRDGQTKMRVRFGLSNGAWSDMAADTSRSLLIALKNVSAIVW